MNTSKNKKTWKEAKSLRLSLGHGNEAEEKFMHMALGVAGEEEGDGRQVAEFMVHDIDLQDFVLGAIDLSETHPAFGAILGQDDTLKAIREFIAPLYLGLLQAETLQGYGYALPRRVEDMPVLIPEDVWFGEVDWESSTVTGGGLSFASVRVASSSETVDTDLISIVTMSLPTAGRPSKKDLILEAFEYGIQEGLLDFTNSNAVTYHKIRQIIEELKPDEYSGGKGLQDGAMQKHLAQLIESNRLN